MRMEEKLVDLRRRQGLSQEQLAERLGVTRQSVSKWESGGATPELSKLVALSELYRVSVDYLVKDWVEEPPAAAPDAVEGTVHLEKQLAAFNRYLDGYRYTSEKKLFGIPLVDIRFSCHLGRKHVARGIIAIGNVAVGVVALGCIPVGAVSLGALSFGLLSIGAVAVGLGALGAVSIGVVAFGSVAMGVYSCGVAAVGQQIAVGVSAVGQTAIGEEAKGLHTLLWGNGLTKAEVEAFLTLHHPNLWEPLRGWLSFWGGLIH